MDDYGNDIVLTAAQFGIETLEAQARFLTEGITDLLNDWYLVSIGAI